MSLNCNEIDVVLSELDLAGAFVQDIVQPSYDSIALYTYKPGEPKTVFVCLAATACRIHETRRKIPKNEKPLRFNELLKSHIKGARIVSCRQLGKERVIALELHKDAPIFVMPAAQEKLAKARNVAGAASAASATDTPSAASETEAPDAENDANAGTDYTLYIRLWSGAANIFLCAGQAAAPAVATSAEHAAATLPYASVPNDGADTQNAAALSSVASAAHAAAALSRASVPNSDAVSPCVGIPAPVIIDCFYRRPAKGEVSGEPLRLPEARTDAGGRVWEVRDFAEIQAQWNAAHPDRAVEPLSFSEKIDRFYSQSAATASLAALLEQAHRWYNEHRSRQSAALDRLKAKRADFQNAAQWKHQGDLILSYGYLLDGSANFLECEDYDTGKTVRLKIDPKKTAQENAAAYYETYKKQTSGMDALDHDIAHAEKALAELDAQYQRMTAEQNPLKLEQLLRKSTTPRQQEKKTHPGLEYAIRGWTLYVGRDANENDELLRHHVRGSDMWLHTRDYAGGYVFIKNRPGKTVPLEILLYAGNLAVYYSKARKNAAADLYYTQVKHLRRAKNAPKGLVLPTQEKNLYIKLDDIRLRELEDMQVD